MLNIKNFTDLSHFTLVAFSKVVLFFFYFFFKKILFDIFLKKKEYLEYNFFHKINHKI